MTTPDPAVGVFTTLLARDGVPVGLGPHVSRLAASVRALYGVAVAEDDLARRIADAVGTVAGTARVRVDYEPAGAPACTVTVTAIDERPRGPWRLVVRRVAGGWGAHKWRDRDVLASWTDPHDPAVDPLLVDEDDRLLETGRGNVFVVRGGVAATPPLDGRILPGVTRAEAVGLLAALGVACEERAVDLAELADADEVFVTGSVGGVRPVASCGDLAWPTGPVTRALDEALERAWGLDGDA